MFHRHNWEYLEEFYILDAYQFSGGRDFTGHQVRRCTKCKRYQYKGFPFWVDCEISGNDGKYYLCERGFRGGKNLEGKISSSFGGEVDLYRVEEGRGGDLAKLKGEE